MKNTNKIKLFASAAAIAAVATPIITLASCNKTQAIDIEEKEKTKELPKGDRVVSYSLTLASALTEGEEVKAELQNITSSQTGYTVNVDAIETEVGKNTANVKVKVGTTTNEILKDGTTFEFSMVVKRYNAEGKETASKTIEGFKITYAAPTTTELKLVGDAAAYTNPHTDFHVYLFDIGTAQVPEGCEFECDVTNTSGQTINTSFVEAKLDGTTNKLGVKFKMDTDIEELEGGEISKFGFTLSCKKDGNELWRQSFSDYQLTYINHLVYIFDEYQEDCTMAGEALFHLYVAKNNAVKKEHLQAGLNITFTPDASLTDVTMTYYPAEVVEGQFSEEISYFDIPVRITGVSETEDLSIDYEVKFEGTIGTSAVQLAFNRNIKYWSSKVTVSTTKTQQLINNTSFDHKLVLGAGYYDDNSFEIINAKSAQGAKVEVGEITQEGATFTVPTIITPVGFDCEVEFDIRVTHKDLLGEVEWQQIIKGFKITYINLATIVESSIETSQDLTTGHFELHLNTQHEVSIDSVAIVDGTLVKKDIADATVAKSEVEGEENIIYATLEPEASGFTTDSMAKFDLNVKFNATIGETTEQHDVVFKNCQVKYFGTMWTEDERYKDTKVGETTAEWSFHLYDPTSTIESVEIKNLEPSTGYTAAQVGKTVVSGKDVTVKVGITSDDHSLIPDNAYADFRFVFKGKTNGKSWERVFLAYRITYRSSITCNEVEQKTYPGTVYAYFTLNDWGTVAASNKYKIEAVQSETAEVKAKVLDEQVTVEGYEIYVPVEVYRKDATPLHDGETASFDLKVTKADSTGKTIATEIVKGCSAEYITDYVTWDEENSWCVYEMETGSTGYTKPITSKFKLKNAVPTGHSINVAFGSYTKSANVDSMSTPTSQWAVGSKEVTLNDVKMKMISSIDKFNVGDWAKYAVIITEKDASGTEVWHQTLDCYLVMLADFTSNQTTIHTTTTADCTFNMTAKLPEEYITSGAVKLETRFERKGGTAPTDALAFSGAPTFSSSRDVLNQKIKWVKTEELTSESYATFLVWARFTVTVGEESFTTGWYDLTKGVNIRVDYR